MATIEMDRAEALQAFRAYRDEVRDRHDAELEQIMAGYRALARGQRLIHLSQTVRAGGAEEREFRYRWAGPDGTSYAATLPRLAVCRADERWCSVDVRSDRSAVFVGLKDHERQWGRVGHRSRLRRVRVTDWVDEPGTVNEGTFDAMVPIVPPQLRPRGHLSRYHVLFEAEWHLREETIPAPRDPALLRRVGGDLFAVVATWDLSDLERAVLSGRSQA